MLGKVRFCCVYSDIITPLTFIAFPLLLFVLFLIFDKRCQVQFPPTEAELNQNENLCEEIISDAKVSGVKQDNSQCLLAVSSVLHWLWNLTLESILKYRNND